MLSFAAVALGGCPAAKNVECIESSNCDLATGGQCLAAPNGNQWCAYPDQNCPGGYRYSDLDVGDGLSGACVGTTTDAGLDSLFDSSPFDGPAPQNRFDVGYINAWDLGTSTTSMTVSGWVRIANIGSQPLNMSNIMVTNVSDNHDTMVVQMTIQNAGVSALAPGFAYGDLSSASMDLIVPKMSEPIQDSQLSLLQITVSPVAPSGTWLVADAVGTIVIGNAYATITVQLRSSGTGSASTPADSRRVSSMPL